MKKTAYNFVVMMLCTMLALPFMPAALLADDPVDSAEVIGELSTVLDEETSEDEEGQAASEAEQLTEVLDAEEAVLEGAAIDELAADEVAEPQGAATETAEESVAEAPENVVEETQEEEEALEDVEDPNRNSFRYTNGVLMTGEATGARRRLAAPRNGGSAQQYLTRGVDVSAHNNRQQKIDWAQAQASGMVDFVMVRIGFTYTSSKKMEMDDYWEYTVAELERLGIPYGVYWYSAANSVDLAKKEAQKVLELLGSHNPQLGVWYDVEDNSMLVDKNNTYSATNKMMMANVCRAFYTIVNNAGHKVGIYSMANWLNSLLTDSFFSSVPIWVANIGVSSPSFNGIYDYWQYSWTGSVPGINGVVDMNYGYIPINGRTISDGVYIVSSLAGTGQVLDIQRSSQENRGVVETYKENGGANQEFYFVYDSLRSAYNISAVHSNKALDIPGSSVGENYVVNQWTKGSGNNQKWRVVEVETGVYEIISILNPNYALTVLGGTAKNGARVGIATRNGSDAQKWTFKVVSQRTISDGVYSLFSLAGSNQVVDIPRSSIANRTAPIMYQYNKNSKNQQYRITWNADRGFYTIVAVHSGKALDVKGGRAAASRAVIQWTPNGGVNQMWAIRPVGSNYEIATALNYNYVWDVRYGKAKNGAQIVIYLKKDQKNQYWTLNSR